MCPEDLAAHSRETPPHTPPRLPASHHFGEVVSEDIPLRVAHLPQAPPQVWSSPLGLQMRRGFPGTPCTPLTFCSPAGHGHGHDDRVLPLHLHHSGNVPLGSDMGWGGTPSEHDQPGGDHCKSKRRLRQALLPKALGTASGKGPETSPWHTHFEKRPRAVTQDRESRPACVNTTLSED